jgi:hypothetical protein
MVSQHVVQPRSAANVFTAEVLLAAAASDMADELTSLSAKITATEKELEDVKDAIKTITTGVDAAVEALVKKLRFKDSDEALQSLRAEKARLEERSNELLKTKNLLLQQQQQSGAGTSMLPVRPALVIFLVQRSYCMLANIVAFRVRVGLHALMNCFRLAIWPSDIVTGYTGRAHYLHQLSVSRMTNRRYSGSFGKGYACPTTGARTTASGARLIATSAAAPYAQHDIR